MSKYNARRTEIDGLVFASKAEATRYAELVLLERAGEISKLRCQVRYPLTVNGRLVCTYIADFVYFGSGNREVVEDVKGVRTPVFAIKAKLMQAVYGITIEEIKP